MIFKAVFTYKGEPAIGGSFPVEGSHLDEASLKVYLMIKNKDDAVTSIGNWDRYEVKPA